MVSYMANGRWYDLRDNGAGQLKGVDAAYGAGTVSYSTGTVSVTLGALPDVGSAVLYAWGAKPNYVNRATNAVPGPRFRFTLGHEDVAPGSVTITWNDGGAKTATDDGKGNITGHITGTIRYATGEVELINTTLPLANQEFDVEFSWSVISHETTSTVSGTITLGNTNLIPGSVEMRWGLTRPAVERDHVPGQHAGGGARQRARPDQDHEREQGGVQRHGRLDQLHHGRHHQLREYCDPGGPRAEV